MTIASLLQRLRRRTHFDLLLRPLDVFLRHRVCAVDDGLERRLIDEVLDLGAAQPRRQLGQTIGVDLRLVVDLGQVVVENLAATFLVGRLEVDGDVEAAPTKQRSAAESCQTCARP